MRAPSFVVAARIKALREKIRKKNLSKTELFYLTGAVHRNLEYHAVKLLEAIETGTRSDVTWQRKQLFEYDWLYDELVQEQGEKSVKELERKKRAERRAKKKGA